MPVFAYIARGNHDWNGFYYPVSALHEPFKSLFASKPAVALRLVRNLANQAAVWNEQRTLYGHR